ncbi:MAG: hypothetical protein HQL59_07140 [Magnetococcales bacterium]|nr:hypothetical protein [Magnetococcales bacterium]
MDGLTFSQRLEGRFDGIFRLADLAPLGETVASREAWYLVSPGEATPAAAAPVTGGEARAHLEKLVAEILREERGEWTTMVYVQSLEDPWIIKVYHPRRAGCGCGGGGGILPWWVFSRIPPEPVPAWNPGVCAAPEAKAPWWKSLF